MGTQPARQLGCRLDQLTNFLLRVDVGTEAGRHPRTTHRVRNEDCRIGPRAKHAELPRHPEVIAARDGRTGSKRRHPFIQKWTRELLHVSETLREKAVEVPQRYSQVLMACGEVLSKCQEGLEVTCQRAAKRTSRGTHESISGTSSATSRRSSIASFVYGRVESGC